MEMGAEPLEVDCSSVFEEGQQLSQGEDVAKLRQLAGIEIEVGQLNVNLFQGVILSVNEAVELGLRPM